MAVPPGAVQLPKFYDTLGALLIGVIVASALWGVLTVQTFIYFTNSPKDRPAFKALIALLWILDTFDSFLNGHILWFYMIVNFANPVATAIPIWSVVLHVAVTSVSNFSIRTMYSIRVFRLSRNNYFVTGALMTVSLADLVIGIIITVRAMEITTWFELPSLANLFYANFASGACSDLGVALSMSYYLWQSRTGFEKTDTLLTRLMTYTLNTGFLVALDASLGMFLYIFMPTNFIFMAFYFQLSKLYLNSYLAGLNARDHLRTRIGGTHSIQLTQLSTTRRFDETEGIGSMPTAVEKSTGHVESVNHHHLGGITIERTVLRDSDSGKSM